MKKSDFYYDLPEELIAQTPIFPRDSSRMLRLDKKTGEVNHDTFSNLPDFLHEGDCLVLNNTRVLPARLYGTATDTGAVIGERSLDVVAGEQEVVNGTKEIYPGLYVCGMAASAVSGTPRMGPIFGGMLLSGKKVADLIIEKLK